MRKALAAVGLSVLALTACSSGDEPQPQPTVTVTAQPEIRYEDRIVNSTPQACLDALAAAEEAFGITGEFVDAQTTVIELVPKAFEAGLNRDMAAAEGIVASMEEYNQSTQSLTSRIAPVAEAFNRAKAECRADAGTVS